MTLYACNRDVTRNVVVVVVLVVVVIVVIVVVIVGVDYVDHQLGGENNTEWSETRLGSPVGNRYSRC